MKICDRCGNKPIGMILVIRKTDEEIDLCTACSEEFNKWKNPSSSLENEVRKPGRPKKDGTN